MKIDTKRFIKLIEELGLKFLEESAAAEVTAMIKAGNFERVTEIIIGSMNADQLTKYEEMALAELAADVDANAADVESGRSIVRSFISVMVLGLVG